MTCPRLFVALPLAAFLLARPALADPSDADRTTARALAAEAYRAYDNKDYATAADRFARADALVHAPTLRLGLARAQAALGKLVEANENLNRIVREGAPANAPRVWAEAVEDARKEVVLLAPRLPWVTINVTGASNAKVLLDGVEVPPAAIGVQRAVDPGRHQIVATADGGARAEAVVTVGEGKSESVMLALKPHAGAPPIVAAAVPVAGAPAGASAAGPPPPPPSSGGSARRTAGFVSLGVGGAGLLVGAITGGLVLSKHGTLASGCTGGRCPQSLVSTLNAYDTDGTISTIGFVAGGVLAAAGIVLVVTAPKTRAPSVGITVSPLAVHGGGGLGATGSF